MTAHVCSWRWLHSVTYFKRLMAAHLFSSRPQSNSRSFRLPTCWLQTMLWFNWMHHFLNWGVGKKGYRSCPWRAEILNACLHETCYQRKMGATSSMWGKCNQLTWLGFRLKSMDAQSAFFLLYFWPVSSNRENKNSWRNVLGLCSLEEEMMVIVLHFCYCALEIALYF